MPATGNARTPGTTRRPLLGAHALISRRGLYWWLLLATALHHAQGAVRRRLACGGCWARTGELDPPPPPQLGPAWAGSLPPLLADAPASSSRQLPHTPPVATTRLALSPWALSPGVRRAATMIPSCLSVLPRSPHARAHVPRPPKEKTRHNAASSHLPPLPPRIPLRCRPTPFPPDESLTPSCRTERWRPFSLLAHAHSSSAPDFLGLASWEPASLPSSVPDPRTFTRCPTFTRLPPPPPPLPPLSPYPTHTSPLPLHPIVSMNLPRPEVGDLPARA